jgi:sugar phosphate isomerase/epimerase
MQTDYAAAWRRTVEAYQQLADACPPGVRVSIEHKPTDESTRWALVPSTGAALLLARDVDRANFGLTLDYGHLLMAGENPAQSAALVGAAGKLFGVQLNDAHVKLGAEDGLAFGSVNPTAALEFVRQLQRVRFDGHIYFDTFPRKEDPVREAEYNIRRFRALWARAARLAGAGIDGFAGRHDAMVVLELLEAEEAQQLPAPAAAGTPA